MKILLILACSLLALTAAFPERTKRDVTCASLGHNSCRWSCKVRGWASGECVWNMNTAAYNCECNKEQRGVLCNIGGSNTCNYTCKMLGRTSGECDDQFRCSCSGNNNRWGSLLKNIGSRL
eukprot:GFUD01024812.1.p1 GENE.GFUD01024812.1~~GFUD01024812.1.p1  ORF type:complete len:121 (+),score=17.67 GFUD01024812.1:48-410(+)